MKIHFHRPCNARANKQIDLILLNFLVLYLVNGLALKKLMNEKCKCYQNINETKFKYNRNRKSNRPCLPSGLTYNVTTVKCCMVCYRSQVRILLGTMISITLSQRRLFAIQIVGRWVAVVPLSILNLGMRKPN